MKAEPADTIIALFELDDWRFNEYTAEHIATGLQLWIIHGPTDVRTTSYSRVHFHIPWWQRRRIFKAYLRAKNRIGLRKLNTAITMEASET